jgi:hypothetical protein
MQGGSATGSVHAAIDGSQHHPVTAENMVNRFQYPDHTARFDVLLISKMAGSMSSQTIAPCTRPFIYYAL